jgi:hypothetical protein
VSRGPNRPGPCQGPPRSLPSRWDPRVSKRHPSRPAPAPYLLSIVRRENPKLVLAAKLSRIFSQKKKLQRNPNEHSSASCPASVSAAHLLLRPCFAGREGTREASRAPLHRPQKPRATHRTRPRVAFAEPISVGRRGLKGARRGAG